MFTDNILRSGHHLAHGLRHLDLGAGDCISRNEFALCYGTNQAHYLLRHSDCGCAVELFFDFAGDLDSERKGGGAKPSITPWYRDLVLDWSERHADRAEPTNIANAGRLRGLWETPAERLPHYRLHVLWIKTLAGTHDTGLERSMELQFWRP